MNKKGFTIIELLISVSIASVITLSMVTVSVYYYGDILRSQATAELAIESQTVLRKIIDDARLADSIHAVGQITDANAPTGGWVTSDPSNVIILADPAIDSSRNIIYNASDSYPYENESIYFSRGTQMYRRLLKNTSAPGNSAITTCPAASVTATCPQDIILSQYVTNLSFIFYDINNVTTADASQARSVSITVNLQRTIYGKLIDFSNTVRTTLRNY
jgi:prepilin-type N-terminal cleavage/methylation domain-containing protein